MLPPVMTMGRSGSRKGNIFLNLPRYSVFLWQFNLYFCAISFGVFALFHSVFLRYFIRYSCAISFGILALFWSVFLLHKIYGAKIGALVNNAVEVGEKLTELRDS